MTGSGIFICYARCRSTVSCTKFDWGELFSCRDIVSVSRTVDRDGSASAWGQLNMKSAWQLILLIAASLPFDISVCGFTLLRLAYFTVALVLTIDNSCNWPIPTFTNDISHGGPPNRPSNKQTSSHSHLHSTAYSSIHNKPSKAHSRPPQTAAAPHWSSARSGIPSPPHRSCKSTPRLFGPEPRMRR